MKHLTSLLCGISLLSASAAAQTAELTYFGLKVNGSGSSDVITLSLADAGALIRVRISSATSGDVSLDSSFSTNGIQRLEILGGIGNDTILNQTHFTATILGEAGNDVIQGGSGIDTILGGNGNDTIRGGADDDVIDGGDGTDYIYGGTGADELTGGHSSETTGNYINGESGNDDITGCAGNDNLLGGSGNDTLKGGLGSDLIRGGDGNDILIGGEAKWSPDTDPDTMIGEGGTDYFAFEQYDTQVGVHTANSSETVSQKWWKGVEPWIYNAWDSNPNGFVKYWQCGG